MKTEDGDEECGDEDEDDDDDIIDLVGVNSW